ncbi:MAG TPA: DUF1501 domain-containing protein [Pirellulaceae bacterium]|nr:DUF1501 domain-containing protein [Pirellulaceae bacterium]
MKRSQVELAHAQVRHQTRRHFLQQGALGVGAIAYSLLEGTCGANNDRLPLSTSNSLGRAKSVIYLHMAGSPSQLELFDYKPELARRHMQPCPDSLLANQKFAFIQGHPLLLGPQVEFAPAGEEGRLFSNLIPHLAKVADELTIVHSCVTDQFNHAPAQLYLLTGNTRFGYPSFGSWVTYGLGSENQNLPGFIVLVSGGNAPDSGKAVWGSGFLPGVHQGVQCRSYGSPILFLDDPPGMSREMRRASLDALQRLNELHHFEYRDPETQTRIEQYELAFRMQIAAPEVMDISRETQTTLDMYGAEVGRTSLANHCLLARRLVEQGVRFVQLFDWGWDVHGTGSHDDLVTHFPKKCGEMDRPVAALIQDLKQRGMLDETLVIWGGEFGRTAMNEARGGSTFLGRDHHPHAFTMFFAGGGMRRGFDYGQTDDFGYFVTDNKVTVRDLQATLLHVLGLDPYHLSFPFQGLNARWIGPTDEGRIQYDLLES